SLQGEKLKKSRCFWQALLVVVKLFFGPSWLQHIRKAVRRRFSAFLIEQHHLPFVHDVAAVGIREPAGSFERNADEPRLNGEVLGKCVHHLASEIFSGVCHKTSFRLQNLLAEFAKVIPSLQVSVGRIRQYKVNRILEEDSLAKVFVVDSNLGGAPVYRANALPFLVKLDSKVGPTN